MTTWAPVNFELFVPRLRQPIPSVTEKVQFSLTFSNFNLHFQSLCYSTSFIRSSQHTHINTLYLFIIKYFLTISLDKNEILAPLSCSVSIPLPFTWINNLWNSTGFKVIAFTENVSTSFWFKGVWPWFLILLLLFSGQHSCTYIILDSLFCLLDGEELKSFCFCRGVGRNYGRHAYTDD